MAFQSYISLILTVVSGIRIDDEETFFQSYISLILTIELVHIVTIYCFFQSYISLILTGKNLLEMRKKNLTFNPTLVWF